MMNEVFQGILWNGVAHPHTLSARLLLPGSKLLDDDELLRKNRASASVEMKVNLASGLGTVIEDATEVF